jgi:serine/threonine-protein kinase RsbW
MVSAWRVGGNSMEMEHRLAHAASSPAEARQIAADLVTDRLSPSRANEFVLMVSEVVGNAVRHGEPEPDGRIGFRLEDEDKLLRAVVTDSAPEFEFDQYTFESANLDHMGLLMVDTLANRWGLSLDGKKAVWFEVDVELPTEQGT